MSGYLRPALGILKWVIALGILSYLVVDNRTHFERLITEPIHWQFLVVAFALCGGATVLTFVRWYILVVALDFPFRFADALRLGFMGCLFNYVGPGGVGGDLVKAVLMAREQHGRRSVAVATILLDRILGLVGLLLVGAAASLVVVDGVEHRDEIVTILWGGSIAGLTGLLVMLHPATPKAWWMTKLTHIPKVGRIVADVAGGISLYQKRKSVLAIAVAMSVVSHLGLISSFYCCTLVVSTQAETLSFTMNLLLFPLAQFVGFIVPVPGGVGALEGAVQELFKLAGGNPGISLLAAGAYRLTQVLIAAIGSVYYLASRRQIQKLLAEEQAALESPPSDSTLGESLATAQTSTAQPET